MPERKVSTEAIDAIDRLLQELWSAARDGDLAWVEIWSDDLREKIADAILPEGTVAVERGRLERLTEYVAADLACTDWQDEDGANPHWERYLAALDALRPGDTEALSDLAGTHDGRG